MSAEVTRCFCASYIFLIFMGLCVCSTAFALHRTAETGKGEEMAGM